MTSYSRMETRAVLDALDDDRFADVEHVVETGAGRFGRRRAEELGELGHVPSQPRTRGRR